MQFFCFFFFLKRKCFPMALSVHTFSIDVVGVNLNESQSIRLMHNDDSNLWIKNHNKFSHFLDDRRRGARNRPTEDNRRHTLGSHNDMLVYSQQNQNIQQRAMDLEVNINKKNLLSPFILFRKEKHFISFISILNLVNATKSV